MTKRNRDSRKETDNLDDDYIAAKKKRLVENDKVKEYAKRISEKEKSKMKNYISGQTVERKFRDQASKFQDNHLVTEDLRVKSRQEYLHSRRMGKIDDLESEINEEILYFKNEKLTKREIEELEIKKTMYKAAKFQEKTVKQRQTEYYNIPSNDSTIVKSSTETQKKPNPSGLNEWETLQIKTGNYQKKKIQKENDEYDILLNEFIDYEEMDILREDKSQQPQDTPMEITEKELTIEEVRKLLPIYKLKEEFISMIKSHQILVIEGETGSGKTTQIPQYLYEAGYCENSKKIGCTQPRRVAAMSVAARVAQEMRVKLGDRVGYSVRFESKVSDQTEIKYMTDGMLLREFMNDPTMAEYSVIIIDEAHERTLQTDILFSLLREITEVRSDLKILISSATCDVQKFCTFFSAPLFHIPGRRYDVETLYTKDHVTNHIEAAVLTVLQIHINQPVVGDILVFLTGQEEIEQAMEDLQKRIKALGAKIKELIVLPIYSALPTEKQAKIFLPTPPGARKVVLATNIAETSLTIDGIHFVIDCGYCKQKTFNPKSRMESLQIAKITKANAIQRAGRAGRVAPGKCFRLYKKCTFEHEFEELTIPEIQRTNLGNVVLLLKALGVEDIAAFEFMDPPVIGSVVCAIQDLYALSALNEHGELTLAGRKMVEIPCDPMIAKMIIKSEKYGCSEEILTIAAMLSLDNTIFYTPKDKKLYATQRHRTFLSPEGDHLTLMNVYNEYVASDYLSDWCKDNYIQDRAMKMARNIRDQLVALSDRLELKLLSNVDDTVSICKAITAGFFINTARFNGDSYKRIKAKDCVYMQKTSTFSLLEERPKYVVFNCIVNTSKEYMRTCTKIDPKWLTEIAPHLYEDAHFESDRKPKQRKYKK